MNSIFFKRLKIIPLTLFLILFLNFILINFSKEPSCSSGCENLSELFKNKGRPQIEDDFSKSYGLHLPILFNRWTFMSEKKILSLFLKEDPKLIQMSPYILDKLHSVYTRSKDDLEKNALIKVMLLGEMQKIVSTNSFGKEEINSNEAKRIILIESLLESQAFSSPELLLSNNSLRLSQKMRILFCETRFYRYFKKIFFLDFGTLRYDHSKKVAPIVLKKLSFSLLLLIVPALITFIFSQLFGLLMALKESRLMGLFLSLFFASLYGIPIYIMAPLLIEKVGLRLGFPIHGMNFFDLSYLVLPTLSLLYSALAIYSRINKALFLKILSQDYLLVAKAKGLKKIRILFVHTFREALLTTAPLLLGSFSFFISSLIIVENLFEIDGFGRFFYQAILTHDYNVIIFSTLLISLTTMTFYLLADIVLYKLDPRISRNADQRVFQRA